MNVELSFGANLNVAFLLSDCFLCHSSLLFSSFLLVSNGFLTALAGTCIVLGRLAANGKTDTVANATVAADIHETLDVKLDFRAEVTFNLVVCADDFANFGCLSVSPILDFELGVNAGLLEDSLGRATSDAEDVGEGNLALLVLGRSTPTIRIAINY